MKTKFTNGEWAIEDGRAVVCNGFRVAYVYSGVSVPFIESIKSNAYLISAAPEMYEMLESLCEQDECQMFKFHIKKLLAKARGES